MQGLGARQLRPTREPGREFGAGRSTQQDKLAKEVSHCGHEALKPLHCIRCSFLTGRPSLLASQSALIFSSLPPALMLRRCTLQAASRLIPEGQGAALWQTLAHQQRWQGVSPAAAAAVGPQLAQLQPGSLRWRSELVQHEQKGDELVYVGPFASAVKRVKVRALDSGRVPDPARHSPSLLAKAWSQLCTFGISPPVAEPVALQLCMRAGGGSHHSWHGRRRHHHNRQGVNSDNACHFWRLHDRAGACKGGRRRHGPQ